MARLALDLLTTGGRPWLGANYWSARGGPFMWRSPAPEVWRRELQLLADHGLTVTRSFVLWPDFMPAPDTLDETFVARYRSFLDLSAQVGLPTIPTFIVGHMSGGNWDVRWRGGATSTRTPGCWPSRRSSSAP